MTEKNTIRNEISSFFDCLLDYEFWLTFSLSDIINRYRRTLLGPWWLVIANFINIVGLAVIGSILYKTDLQAYLPKLAVGMIIWQLISGCLNEGCTALTQYAHIIKCLPIPLYQHVLRTVSKYVLIFIHNLAIYAFVCIAVQNEVGLKTFLVIPGFLLMFLFLIFLVIIFSILGARFRDLALAVTSLTTMLIFVTPVMWTPEMLGKKAFLAYLNPLTHIIEIIKAPLLNYYPSLYSVGIVLFLVCFQGILSIYLIYKYKSRIPFWV